MKVGIRKPNIKTRVKARTTGKIKRKAKKAVNPLYEKKEWDILMIPKRQFTIKSITKQQQVWMVWLKARLLIQMQRILNHSLALLRQRSRKQKSGDLYYA